MASKRQIRANRRNSQGSTGPRSAAGKAASSANALRHGLAADRAVVLPDEDGDAFERLSRGVVADLDPQDTLQAALAQRIAVLLWRLDRAARLEAELFVHGQLVDQRARLRAAVQRGVVRATLDSLCKDGDGAGANTFSEAARETDRVARKIDTEIFMEAPSARVLVEREESARAFDRLARHEGTLQRALKRTLADYRDLRRATKAAATDAAAEASPPADEAAEAPPDRDVSPPAAPSGSAAAPPRRESAPAQAAPAAGAPAAAAAGGAEKGFLQNEPARPAPIRRTHPLARTRRPAPPGT